MYPIYPAIALNAAYSSHILISTFTPTDSRSFLNKVPPKIRIAFSYMVLLLAVTAGTLRTLGLVTGYTAPLNVLNALEQPSATNPGTNVCLGKEWYRFPSSYHLPSGMRAKFIKSEFAGLLPGEFSEATNGFGWFPGAWLVPSGMNDLNIEDPGKYVRELSQRDRSKQTWHSTFFANPLQTDIEFCHYLIDSSIPSAEPSALEPDYTRQKDVWERIKCEPFLDVGATGAIGRLIWLPSWLPVPGRLRRKWGEYCLLKRRRS